MCSHTLQYISTLPTQRCVKCVEFCSFACLLTFQGSHISQRSSENLWATFNTPMILMKVASSGGWVYHNTHQIMPSSNLAHLSCPLSTKTTSLALLLLGAVSQSGSALFSHSTQVFDSIWTKFLHELFLYICCCVQSFYQSLTLDELTALSTTGSVDLLVAYY